jgi:type I restriction enzyme S subunit
MRLGDVCEIIKGRKPVLKTIAANADLPYLVAKVLRGSKEAEYASVNDRNSITVQKSETIIICDGSNSGEVFTGFHGILSSTMGKIAKKAEIDDDYLRAFLASTFDVFNGAKTGAAIPHLDKEAMYQLQVPVPPLSEQQRIVGILDEAFEGIAAAKANAERNLRNARALFTSHLRRLFDLPAPGWLHTTIGDQLTLQRGFDITKDQQVEGPVPVVSSGGIKSFHNKAMVSGPGVVIGRKGTLGKAFFIESDFWPHDTTLWVKDFKRNEPRFVYYFFTGLDVKKLNSGSANPALNRNQVHPIRLFWPPVESQRKIVEALDELEEQSNVLAQSYERKVAALDALKGSLLHQAFSGQL